MKLFRLATTALLASTLGLIAAQADAQTAWQRNHPWRTHDNARLANQNYRINQGLRDGQLSRNQARALRSDDHAIRAEERADSAINGTHLTRADQRQINSQENANSRAIYDGRHY